jgi:hypothetical protein
MSVVVVISQHLLNVFVQLGNKRRFKTKQNKKSTLLRNITGANSTLQAVA